MSGLSLLLAVYRLALLLYPPRFRAEYADEMTHAFGVRVARAHQRQGITGTIGCVLRAVLDLLVNGPRQRMSDRQRCSGAFEPRPPTTKGDRMTTRMLHTLRHALRALVRQPAISATIIAVLAIGSAATISIFSVVDAALLRPLPYPDADRLTTILQRSESTGTSPFGPPYLVDLRDRLHGVDQLVGLSQSWAMTMTGAGEPRVVMGAFISDGLLELLGARPVQGRLLTPDEYLADGPSAVVVSRALWARHFGVDTALDGQTVRLSGEPYTVVGVIDDLRMPIISSSVSQTDESAELWLPFVDNQYADLRVVPVMNVLGRLAPGIEVGRLDAELAGVHAALVRAYPDGGLGERFEARRLADQVARDSRSTVLTLFGAAVFLLLIACANVANLMLTRATRRSHEMSIRASLGASTARLIGLGMIESALVSAIGCGAGLLLAVALLSAVPSLGLESLPPSADVRLDGRVAVFTMLLAVGTAALFGSFPALHAARVGTADPLRSARGVIGGARLARNGLVVAEVALALMLLIGAGLLARSFWRLTQVDPGFRAEGLVAVPLSMASAGYSTPANWERFLADVIEQLRGVPGVDGAAAVNRVPLGGSNVWVGVEVEGRSSDDGTAPSDRRVVTPGYFDTVGIPLVEGRDFNAGDTAGSDPPVTILNHEAARRFWPDRDPLGRRIRLMLRGGPGPWMTVVGVIGDVRHHSLTQPAESEVYVPFAQARVASMVAIVHGPRRVEAIIPAVKGRVRALSGDVPLNTVVGVESVVDGSVSEPRFRMLILGAFAALALALSAVGVTAVVSYSVAQRTRDIGVRMALGAQRLEILWHTLRQGLTLGALGAGIGLAGALAASHVLEALLFEVTATDPLTFATVAAALMAIVGIASYVPARRATSVDPVVALRAE